MTLLELLKEIEYVGEPAFCPWCKLTKHEGHADNCRLKIAQAQLSLIDTLRNEAAAASRRIVRLSERLGVKL